MSATTETTHEAKSPYYRHLDVCGMCRRARGTLQLCDTGLNLFRREQERHSVSTPTEPQRCSVTCHRDYIPRDCSNAHRCEFQEGHGGRHCFQTHGVIQPEESMNHSPDCKWERTTESECAYKATHYYCPHPEHACTCPPAEAAEAPERVPAIPEWTIVRVEQRTGRDCLRCCVAMVTRVNYADVPDFCAEAAEAWPTALEEWLSTVGMGLLMFGNAAPEYVPSWLPIIAQGRTDRSSMLHFVVVTSDAVIDPSPYQSGLTEITDRYAIVNSGALANGFIEHLGKKYAETAAEVHRLREALRGVAGATVTGWGDCWCQHPSYKDHTLECAAAREAMGGRK